MRSVAFVSGNSIVTCDRSGFNTQVCKTGTQICHCGTGCALNKPLQQRIIFGILQPNLLFLQSFISSRSPETGIPSVKRANYTCENEFQEGGYEMIEKLRELKKKSHMTNQQIAEKVTFPRVPLQEFFRARRPTPRFPR